MTPEELLFNLGACLCDALEASPGGATGTCCVVATQPVVPECCEGFAWVRTTGSVVLPFEVRQRCLPPVWALQVELGVTRCAALPCKELGNPCCDPEADATLTLLGDFTAMQQALLCCLPAIAGAPKLDQITIQGWTVDEPLGACATSRMLASIEYLNSCAC